LKHRKLHCIELVRKYTRVANLEINQYLWPVVERPVKEKVFWENVYQIENAIRDSYRELSDA
jgi:hypothetical protein